MNFSGIPSRAKLEWNQWRWSCRSRRDLRRYSNWISSLRITPPEVFVGPDLPYGGVRGHIRGIARHSSLNTEVVPNGAALGGLEKFSEPLRKRFFDYQPSGRPSVHSHVIPWFIDWCQVQQSHGCPWIHTYHLNYFPEHNRGQALRPDQVAINQALLGPARNANIKLSVAKWQCDWLSHEHGIETDYLPNGVDVLACNRGDGSRFRNRFRIADPFVLWVGRNDPVKNPGDFVRLAQEMVNQSFVMIGADLDEQRLEEEWGLHRPGNLMMLGASSSAEVQDAIAACQAIVVTSYREGLPTLVLEGMAQACPIVAFDEPGSREALGDGDFGYLAKMGDISSLAEQVHRALQDEKRPIQARERVLEEYDWRVVIRKLDAIYRSGSF